MSFHSLTQKTGACFNNVIFSQVLLVQISVKLYNLKLRYTGGADKPLARPGNKLRLSKVFWAEEWIDLARVGTGGGLL